MIHDDEAFTAWRRWTLPHFESARREAISYLEALRIDEGFLLEQYRKSRRGWAEHDGGIRFMKPEEVEAMAREEVIDLLTYRAHIHASRG